MLCYVITRQTPHFSSLSALRFAAAVTVAFGHSIGYLNNLDHGLLYALGIPSLMVFFHVLSGFTLASIYAELSGKDQVFRFWMARIGRIWPVHVFVLALVIVCFPQHQASGHLWWWHLAAHFTLTQSWFPLWGSPSVFNGPSWTLSTEFGLYLLFPVLICRWRNIWRWALPMFFLIAWGATFWANILEHNPCKLLEGLHLGPLDFVYVHPIMRLFEFSVGMTLAIFWGRASERYRVGSFFGTALEICAVCFVLLTMIGSPVVVAALDAKFKLGKVWGLWLDLLLLPLGPFTCLIMIFSLGRGWVSRLMSASWLVFLGELSFTIYLVHTPLIWAMQSSPTTSSKLWIITAVFWISVFLLAHIIHVVWEQPWRRFFRNILSSTPHKTIPDQVFAHFPWKTRWKLPAVEFAVLTILISTVLWDKYFRLHLHILTETQATKITHRSLRGLRGLQFGDGFALEGILHQWTDSGLQLQLVWRSLKNQRLDYVIAVHCIDHDGKLLGGADYPQEMNRRPIASGDLWVDTVTLRKDQLKEATSIGLGMYRLGEDLIPIDRGTRDWRDRRLLIDIESQMSTPAKPVSAK